MRERKDWPESVNSKAAGASASPIDDAALRVMTHELRTPLAAIAAVACALREERIGTPAPEQYIRYANDICEAAQHALNVLDDAISDHDGSGDPAASRGVTDVDVPRLVRDVVSWFKPLAERAGVGLEVTCAPDRILLVASHLCVRQIVINLLNNAVRFTPPGGEIQVAVEASGTESLSITVADNGDGMASERVAQMRRVLAGEMVRWRPGRPGGGVGLALAAKLAAANGGAIKVSSACGSGTTMSLVFPSDRLVVT